MTHTDDQDNDQIVYGQPRPGDADAIGELFFEDMADLGVDTTRKQMVRFANEVIEAATGPSEDAHPTDCLCWVARPGPDGDPCGVVLANFNWSLKFGGRALWIEELYVTPAFRRRAIGRHLVSLVLDYAEDHDLKGIDLEAYQGNTPASVLYRTLGFHRLGRERFYYLLGGKEFL